MKSITVPTGSVGHYKPINSNRYLSNCFEDIYHFTKTGEVGLDKMAVGVPYQDKGNLARWKSNNGVDLRDRGDAWFVPYETVTSSKNHPAAFPTDLVVKCLKLTGIKEGLVFDPFMGSGTTAIGALSVGWSFTGCDIDQGYADLANSRIASFNPKPL